MGGAMLRGWIAGGVLANSFTIVDPYVESLPEGVTLHRSASEVSGKFDVMLLGIKPQMVRELAGPILSLLAADATVISILAGTEANTLAGHFPGRTILRLMPNLAAAIGESPLAFFGADAQQREAIANWFAPLGTTVWIESEDQMNAVTALAGSGPAFVYRFIDALAVAGAEIGLPADIAAQLAMSTVKGAALLAADADESPAKLAARVTSPGGTTAAGLAILDNKDALNRLIEATLRAARDRGAELAKGS